MRFDTIIIGGGLSGLMGGITLSRQGERVAIISSGKSALQFSSGSLELWSDGAEAIASIADKSPNHPYNKVEKEMLNAFRCLNVPQIMAFQRSSPLLFRSLAR